LKLFILGLRRSGTTITWKTVRQDGRITAFNEPFNPLIRKLPDWDAAADYSEFQRLIDEDPETFRRRFAPIPPEDELQDGLRDDQAAYLRYLLSRNEHVAFDMTRCHFKIEAIHAMAPDGVMVHLFRRPSAHASSHLLPSRRGLKGRVLRSLQRSRFWTRRTGFDFWYFETIVGSTPNGPFARRLAEVGLDPEKVYSMPAVGKLLAYWRVHYDTIERRGRALFGERFLSVPFERFCRRPAEVIEKVYAAGDLAMPDLDFTRIHPPNPGYLPDDPRWNDYCDELGLTGITTD
jgi:hypothetical protein